MLQMGIPNAARILGQTGVLGADDGGRRRIGRCGHSLFGKAGMDGEQCHYQQHQSAAQQANIHITFPIVHSETPLFHFCPARRTRFRCGPPLSVRSRTTKYKKAQSDTAPGSFVCVEVIIVLWVEIVKGSERVSFLGAHRFILFGVLHPPHQRFGVLFAFGVHFFKAGAVLGQGGHSLGAVRGDDADKALPLQLPCPLDSRVVPPYPAAQPLGCSGVMRLQQVRQMLVPGITAHQPDGLGQDESHPVAAVGKGPFQRDGVGQAAIKIRHAVDDAGLVDNRDLYAQDSQVPR